MKKFFNMLKKDDDTISVGRFTAVVAFLLWFFLSLYMALKNQAWGSYETFSLTMVALVLAQLGNKAIECRLLKIGKGDNQHG